MKAEDHVEVTEKALAGWTPTAPHAGLELQALELRLRLAEVQVSLDRADRFADLVDEVRPALKRFLTPPEPSPFTLPPMVYRPSATVVCLCGSTRFMDEFFEAEWRETLAGKIVLSIGVSKHLPADHGGESLGPDVVARLDELHLRKIEMADEVLVLNVGGYVGESTTNEVRHAFALGRLVRWLDPGCIPEAFQSLTAAQPYRV
jgi:hypothetical protein